ncbi:hypothetical protein V8E55_007487 [Tylopilus felleus]
MTKLAERISPLPDTCVEANPFSSTPAGKKNGESNHGESREVDTMSSEDPRTISKSPTKRTLSGSMHAPLPEDLVPQTNSHIDRISVLYETPPSSTHSVSLSKPEDDMGCPSTITETISKRNQDLSASIHAPQRMSNREMQPSVSPPQDEINRDHHRSIISPVVSETQPVKKPCSPNWMAMPEVVDAFRMFKEVSSGNAIQRVSSISESSSRGPMLGTVGQKGIATNSLNNMSATASIQNRWMHGNGLLLIRDIVSSDPADFNESCR